MSAAFHEKSGSATFGGSGGDLSRGWMSDDLGLGEEKRAVISKTGKSPAPPNTTWQPSEGKSRMTRDEIKKAAVLVWTVWKNFQGETLFRGENPKFPHLRPLFTDTVLARIEAIYIMLPVEEAGVMISSAKQELDGDDSVAKSVEDFQGLLDALETEMRSEDDLWPVEQGDDSKWKSTQSSGEPGPINRQRGEPSTAPKTTEVSYPLYSRERNPLGLVLRPWLFKDAPERYEKMVKVAAKFQEIVDARPFLFAPGKGSSSTTTPSEKTTQEDPAPDNDAQLRSKLAAVGPNLGDGSE